LLIPEGREIPDSFAVAQQSDRRLIDDELGDIELFAEKKRHQFDANPERFRLNKGRAAESGIVCDGELVGLHAAREDAEAEIAYGHRASQSRGEVRLNLRAEIVDIDQEGNGDDENDQHSDDEDNDSYNRFHGGAS
jgi:hypothetical protein